MILHIVIFRTYSSES